MFRSQDLRGGVSASRNHIDNRGQSTRRERDRVRTELTPCRQSHKQRRSSVTRLKTHISELTAKFSVEAKSESGHAANYTH